MAEFGAKHPCFKKNTAGSSGKIIGKLIAANLTVNLASGELWADDGLSEQLSEFASGTIALETDNMSDEVAGELYGATVSEGLVTYKQGDTPPVGTFGYYKVLMVNGIRKFRAYVYPKVRAALGNDNAQTRGAAITFQTTQTTITVFADDTDGTWRKTKTFDKETEAVAYINGECGVTTAPGT